MYFPSYSSNTLIFVWPDSSETGGIWSPTVPAHSARLSAVFPQENSLSTLPFKMVLEIHQHLYEIHFLIASIFGFWTIWDMTIKPKLTTFSLKKKRRQTSKNLHTLNCSNSFRIYVQINGLTLKNKKAQFKGM